jgi:hypothetical protein
MFIKGYVWHLAILGVAGVLAMGSSCSGTAGAPPLPPPPPPVTTCASDPLGDTQGAVGTIYDITNVCMTRSAPVAGARTTVSVTITFAQPVLLPPPGGSPDVTTLVAVVGFDVDGNFADGAVLPFCGALGTYNVDEVISMGNRLADGNYPISAAAGPPAGEATPFVNGNSITLVLGLATVGGAPISLGMAIGNKAIPTDCAPNSGYISLGSLRRPLSLTPGTGKPWRSWTSP